MKKLLLALVLIGFFGFEPLQQQLNNYLAANDNDSSQSSQQQQSAQKPAAPAPKVVAWLTLDDGGSGASRLLSGQVSPAEVTRLSFESSGKIESIDVKLGDHFRKGQRLATLDTTNYRLQLRQAKAAFGTAVANRDQARKEVQRFQRLVEANAASGIQLDGYRLQLKTAQEAINSAQAQIELAQKQLRDTVLIAPFNGVVTAQTGEVGQLASPSVPIFTVEADAHLEVSLGVPENLIPYVYSQQQVAVRISALPRLGHLIATVTEISSQASYGAFTVKLVLNNAPAVVKPGMTAEVQLLLPQLAGGFNIPPSALGAGKNNQHFVYRIVADTQAEKPVLKIERVKVQVESLAGNQLRIHGDLQRGDKLVRSGWSFLAPNQTVRLMDTGAQTVNP
ncbi:MAG: hypothetical protein CR974_01900 [Gammaproteobacteria bacterium]|nr:MAG: hypothetical protein CR974_01900 [Gammaproteobacteria bacterium]